MSGVEAESEVIEARCCIAGGGPAGMMLGLLLARAGVPVVVLEKHADFLRDFRGDTVHPSTLRILRDIGLLPKFAKLPQRRVQHLGMRIGEEMREVIDFRGLRPFDYLSLVPQWDFLDLLADEGRRYPHFDLRMRHEVEELVEEDGRVVGVRGRSPEGEFTVRADLVVGCDGRGSTVREAAGLQGQNYGAPMDVLWFRLPRGEGETEETFALVGAGKMMILLNRTTYWQAAYVVPKGSDGELREQPLGAFRDLVTGLAPFLRTNVEALQSWEEVRTLEVRVDRLERWYKPGLLLIGDAAHAMSPIGGVGINLALQDAVAAANALARPLGDGRRIEEGLLERIQERRMLPTKVIQALQLQVQKRVISRVLGASEKALELPRILRWLLGFRVVRNVPGWLIG